VLTKNKFGKLKTMQHVLVVCNRKNHLISAFKNFSFYSLDAPLP